MIDPLGGPAFWWPLLAGAIVAYLIGGIPFGLLLTKWTGAGDLTKIGSGNIGATNVLRTGRKGLAAATLALDALKGLLPVLLASRLFGPDMAKVCALAAVVGHCFSPYLRLRGGKGVGTGAGVVFALAPGIGVLALAVFAGTVALTRYVSLGSILTALSVPIAAWLLGSYQYVELFALIALLLIGKHHANIGRLLRGTENRLGGGKPSAR